MDTGGAERSAIEISEAVTRAGGRAIVASEGGRLEPALKQAGGVLVRLPAAAKNPVQMAANARALVRLIRRENIALVHARSRAPAWSALVAARRTGIAFVTTYHGAYGERGYLKSFYNSVMARGDMVIANSRYIAGLIRDRYRTDPQRITVIYRGVDIDGFDPRAIEQSRLHKLEKAWGIGKGDLVILQAARLTRWKDHATTIAAFDRLAPDGPFDRAVVIFAGDAQGRDGYRRQLSSDIAARGLDHKIRLVGHCDDMPAAFALAHVAIVGSDGRTPEAFGRAAAEAQAACCPVIAADFGAPPEIICASPPLAKDQRTGWLFPPASPAALAKVLGEALALPPSERRQMGLRARQHIASQFTDEVMKYQTLKVYDRLLSSDLAVRFDH